MEHINAWSKTNEKKIHPPTPKKQKQTKTKTSDMAQIWCHKMSYSSLIVQSSVAYTACGLALYRVA